MSVSLKRLTGWAVFIGIVLMIPLLAMNFTSEVKWNITDFLVAGGALAVIGILYELVARKSQKTTYRMAFGVGLLGAVLLFWVNGAVGLIGSENQNVNLLFATVFVVGAVGALLSRFRPSGMAKTLYTAAAVQMLIPAVALIVWPPSVISWSPGILGVFLLCGFFAFLFCVSGMLFNRAAGV